LIRINKMKKTMSHPSFALCLLSLLISLIIVPLSYQAQASESDRKEAEYLNNKNDDFKLQFYTETAAEYTDNIFGLTDDQILKMEINDETDQTSGHFKDMDSAADLILAQSFGVKMDSESPLGGTFGLTSWIRYNYFTENQECSFPEARLRLKNSVWGEGLLSLEGNFIFGYFKKNYLSAVNDENENGNIPRYERTYSPATYDEYEGIIEYAQKLINDKGGQVSGFEISPFMGYRSRIYNSPFGNRDQDVGIIGLGMDVEFISRVNFEIIYRHEGVSSPGKRELVLYDETLSNSDVNGDGEIKGNAPLVTVIDRSSKRNIIEINPTFKLTKDADLFIGYERRVSEYTSKNRLDIDHYNIEASRQQFKTGFRYSFSKAWSAEAEYARTKDHDEEDGGYSQNNYLLKIKYDFK